MITKFLETYLGRAEPADPDIWHKWAVLWPVRLRSGGYSRPHGQIWRRRVSGRWEYQQDAETIEDIQNDAW